MSEARVHGALHTLWTKSVGTEGYDKEQWAELSLAIDELKKNTSTINDVLERAAHETQKLLTILLKNIAGQPKPCRGCQAPIYWVTHANGKRAPYNPTGTNHFATCPQADQFRSGDRGPMPRLLIPKDVK